MYAVSEDYQLAIMDETFTYGISGTIGDVGFFESNIVQGSFRMSNQCVDTSKVALGGVFTAMLEATFAGVNIARKSWKKKEIHLSVGMKLRDGTFEYIPFQPFIIKEAIHTAEGVKVTAYDYMSKFDKKFSKSMFMATTTAYDLAFTICEICGVTLGMTRAEMESLPNGLQTFSIVGISGDKADYANDIDTYRDMLYWLAQTVGCFATINRSGELIFKKFRAPRFHVDDSISDAHRLSGAEFADYITDYTGGYFTDTETGDETFVGDSTGSYIEFGENPFVQGSNAAAMRSAIVGALDQIVFTPFTCSTVFGIHYDLGDVIDFSGGHAGDNTHGCIMAFDWTLNGEYQMQGFGLDPDVPVVRTRTQKSASMANKNAASAKSGGGGGGGGGYTTSVFNDVKLLDYTAVS